MSTQTQFAEVVKINSGSFTKNKKYFMTKTKFGNVFVSKDIMASIGIADNANLKDANNLFKPFYAILVKESYNEWADDQKDEKGLVKAGETIAKGKAFERIEALSAHLTETDCTETFYASERMKMNGIAQLQATATAANVPQDVLNAILSEA